MKNIVENLTHQHRELTRLAMELMQLLDGAALAADAQPARNKLRALTGILRVHLQMEDNSFYPYLLAHKDEEIKTLAGKFLSERDQIQESYNAYSSRWLERSNIENAPVDFMDQTRNILFVLGNRMMSEDRKFHPKIISRWEAQ